MKFKNKSKEKILNSVFSLLVAMSIFVPMCSEDVCAKGRFMRVFGVRRARPDYSAELFRAVEQNNIFGIQTCVGLGANINAQNDDGDTPLHVAARQGVLLVVRTLLRYRPDVDIQNNDDETPLYCAVDAGNVDIAEELLRNNAAPNIADNLGYTPLHIASSRGYYALVCSLLAHDANGNAQTIDGDILLTLAISEDADEGTVRRLLNYRGVEFNLRGAGGNTPLHEAVLLGDVELVRDLISRGADVNAQNSINNSPLIFTTFDSGDPETAEILLNSGAHCDLQCARGRTALHWAAEIGNLDLVRLLLQRGARLDIQDNDGRTPRDLATAPAVVQLLDEHHA